jgi:hypothetical protein
MTIHRITFVAVLLATASPAAADGEQTPVYGLAVIGGDLARAPDQRTPVAGLGLELASWHGRLGLALEGSARWSIASDAARALVLGASARVRVLDGMMPSLLDPRDVEVGLELQAIVERAWMNVADPVDPTAYGLGIALRVRGSGDPDNPALLSESRFFLRVMSSRWSELDMLARTMTTPPAMDRAVTVLLGIGASFGGGSPGYMERFRLHPHDPTLL